MYHNIFDSHAHYDDEQFEYDRNELLVSFKEKGVSGVICCGVDVKTSEFAVELSHKYDFVYLSNIFVIQSWQFSKMPVRYHVCGTDRHYFIPTFLIVYIRYASQLSRSGAKNLQRGYQKIFIKNQSTERIKKI